MDKINTLIELERQLFRYDGEDKILSSYDLLEALKHEDRAVDIKSGFVSLDGLIKGFQGGELTVISGLTGNGKTLLAQTLTVNFAQQAIKSLWFSYEVITENFLRAFGDELPLFYLPARLKDCSVSWLSERIHEGKLKYEIDAVFIDHLHFLVNLNKGANMSTEIGGVMRELKKLALRFNLCIFLIAHTMKIKPETELTLGDTRDSSFIEQEADNVFYIWRLKNSNQAILKIAKNRRYGIFERKLKLIKQGNFLFEVNNAE